MFGRRLNFENEESFNKSNENDVEMSDDFGKPPRAIKLDLFGSDDCEFPGSPLKDAWTSSNTPGKSKSKIFDSHIEETWHSKNLGMDEDMSKNEFLNNSPFEK